MGFLSFLSKLLGLGRQFKGTPEQYLAMIQYIAGKNNPHYSVIDLMQWDSVMQKVMKVSLSPYRDFQDLMLNGIPDESKMAEVDSKYNELQHRKDLKQALYGENVDLGDDDVMTSNSPDAIFARKFIKDMSKHVEFPDDEQRKLDNL